MDLFRFDPPSLTAGDVASIAAEHYGLSGTMQRLRGERSHNTLITTSDGRRVVLKIASHGEPHATISFHAEALVHLERHAPELPVARMIPSSSGELVPRLEREGKCHSMRVVTFLPGTPFLDGQPLASGALRAIGELVGRLSVALADFWHPASDTFMPWDIANGLILDDRLWGGLGADADELLVRARPRLESAHALMSSLPRQVIHNDAHAGNLLRASSDCDRVTGVIDFGDLVHTVAVADLGVSGANLAPHQADPIGAMANLVAGFHTIRPLSDDEVRAVPELVLCRLALSTLLVDYQIADAPHIAEEVGAERLPLLESVRRWLGVEPTAAVDAIDGALS